MLKVSVISGIYNAEKHLYKCLNSILKQTYDNFEVILVVNACKDRSLDICTEYKTKYPDKITIFTSEKKLGAGGSRDWGVQHATGDYICFVDCDDEINLSYIENLVNAAEKSYLPDIVFCNFTRVDASGKIKYIRKYKTVNEALIQSVAPWAKLFRRKYLIMNQMVFRNIPFGEDIAFASEIYLTHPRTALSYEQGYYWLDNPLSTSHTEIRNFPKKTIEIVTKYFHYLFEKYPNEHDILCYFVFKYMVWYLLQSGRNVKKNNMITEYERAFSYLNTNFPNWKSNKYLTINTPIEERTIVRLVLCGVRMFEKIKIGKLFFQIYTFLPMEHLWPSL